MKKYAIIVAGGNGSRMKSDLPKQFIQINNIPIIATTINKFLSSNCEVIIVLPKNHVTTFKNDILNHCNSQEMHLVTGGETRFHSVKNGLNFVQENSLVAVHDAVRPFITSETIENSFLEAKNKGNAITSVELKDSIRYIENNQNKSVNRSNYRLIQTPQTFNSNLLKKAYNQKFINSFTDDASVFEADGNTINLIQGDYKNIKITTPEDLLIANAFSK